MKAKLLVVALCCIFAFPLLSAVSDGSDIANFSTAQYAAAVAGHTQSGQFCVCPSPGCRPDIGEICDGVTRAPGETESSDYGAPVLLLLVAGFVFLRLRSIL